MREIEKSVVSAIKAIEFLKKPENLRFIKDAAELIADAFAEGKKLLIAGNGGSLCDAMHFAEELSGYFRKKRKALPALALSDPGHMTCVANDTSFSEVFSRGVEALGNEGDLLAVLSTSGNSENILRAISAAKRKGLKTLAFLGKDGGKIKGACDLELIISGFSFSDRIQEAHMAAIHIIIEMIEERLFEAQEVKENEHCYQ